MAISQNTINPAPEFVAVDPERAGQRIDNFLMAYLRGVPRSKVYRILRTGEVRVNKGRVKPAYRVRAGDVVRIPPLQQSPAPRSQPSDSARRRVEENIIFEDAGLIVLNKPAGMAVHGGSGVDFGVIEAMRAARPGARHLELIHRLDRDTSGCLMIAKKRSVLRFCHELLRNDGMEKHYQALCRGRWQGGGRWIDAPLRKSVLRSGERVVSVCEAGKQAMSRFVPRRRFEEATLLDVELKTGRTHQIRVHAVYAGHPLAHDEKYGDRIFNQWVRSRGLRQLFLHAHRLRLPDYASGEMLEIEAPLPHVLTKFLETLAPLR